MPVAALIVVRPAIQVKAIKGDALSANRNRRELWAHIAIKAILVHAEIGWGIAQADEAGQRDVGRPYGTHRLALQARSRDFSLHQRPSRTLWFRSFRVKLSRMTNHARICRKSQYAEWREIQRNCLHPS
jgi:hypothetical protein